MNALEAGVYRRIWVDEDGVERHRMMAVREGRATDLRKARSHPLSWWDGKPGEWVHVGPLGPQHAAPVAALVEVVDAEPPKIAGATTDPAPDVDGFRKGAVD